MAYIIKTDTLPDNLPAGATVERLPRTFPAAFKTATNRTWTISPSGSGAYVSVAEVNGLVGSTLTKNETREIANTLLEAIGDNVPDPVAKQVYNTNDDEPPAEVKSVRDRDGDNWYRVGGGWSTSRTTRYPETWSFVRRYAPLTVVPG